MNNYYIYIEAPSKNADVKCLDEQDLNYLKNESGVRFYRVDRLTYKEVEAFRKLLRDIYETYTLQEAVFDDDLFKRIEKYRNNLKQIISSISHYGTYSLDEIKKEEL
jgi:hypothetical protein